MIRYLIVLYCHFSTFSSANLHFLRCLSNSTGESGLERISVIMSCGMQYIRRIASLSTFSRTNLRQNDICFANLKPLVPQMSETWSASWNSVVLGLYFSSFSRNAIQRTISAHSAAAVKSVFLVGIPTVLCFTDFHAAAVDPTLRSTLVVERLSFLSPTNPVRISAFIQRLILIPR